VVEEEILGRKSGPHCVSVRRFFFKICMVSLSCNFGSVSSKLERFSCIKFLGDLVDS
jgi:hypothetical protein